MRRATRVVALRAMGAVLAGLTLTGCYDTRQEIYLNPDGTGRAILESSFAQEDPLKNETVSSAEAIVRSLIQDAEGVDAWRDISCEEREDGRFHLRATAYFRELKEFKTRVNQISRFSASRDGGGRLRVESSVDRKESPLTLPATNEAVTAESIRRERRQFRANQPLFAAMLASVKVETTFHLPGTLESLSNFERASTNSFRLRFDGARAMSVIERFLFDPEIARRHPPQVRDYKLGGQNDTSERTNVFFSLGFGLPARDSRGWAELSGEIECASAQNFQEIELISGLLLPGTKGNAFTTELESVSNNKPGGLSSCHDDGTGTGVPAHAVGKNIFRRESSPGVDASGNDDHREAAQLHVHIVEAHSSLRTSGGGSFGR